jgi:hypothetical protein
MKEDILGKVYTVDEKTGESIHSEVKVMQTTARGLDISEALEGVNSMGQSIKDLGVNSAVKGGSKIEPMKTSARGIDISEALDGVSLMEPTKVSKITRSFTEEQATLELLNRISDEGMEELHTFTDSKEVVAIPQSDKINISEIADISKSNEESRTIKTADSSRSSEASGTVKTADSSKSSDSDGSKSSKENSFLKNMKRVARGDFSKAKEGVSKGFSKRFGKSSSELPVKPTFVQSLDESSKSREIV